MGKHWKEKNDKMPLDRYLLTRLCTYIESLTKPLISVRFYRIIDWFLQNLQNIIFRAYFISFFSSPCLRLPSSLMILWVWSTTRPSLVSLQASLREADFIQLKFNSLVHWIHNPRLPFQDPVCSNYKKFVRNLYIKLRQKLAVLGSGALSIPQGCCVDSSFWWTS